MEENIKTWNSIDTQIVDQHTDKIDSETTASVQIDGYNGIEDLIKMYNLNSEQAAVIIEDDFESEFSVLSKPEDTLYALSEDDNVIYINTFSKTIAPSIRIGYMILPEKLMELFQTKVGFYSCTVPSYEQYVLAEFMDSGEFERHINRVRRQKRRSSKQNKKS